MSSSRVNMDRLIQATIDGFNALDYEPLRAVRSDDFIYQFLPKSLNAPARNNDEYAEFWATNLRPVFKTFKATPTAITHDVDAKRSVIFADIEVDTIAGPATIEVVIMFTFNEAVDKIARMDEFFDTAVYTAFFAKVAEMLQSAAAAGEAAAAVK